MKKTSKGHKRSTKLLALILSVLMILGACPVVFAADGDTAADTIVTKWPVAEKEIEFGQYYSDAGLKDGEASIPGEFMYTSTTTVARSGGLGVKSRDIKFVPTDTTVEPVLGKVDVTVVKSVSGKLVGTPTSTPMQIGQKLNMATFVKTGVRLESYALKTSSFKIDWKEPGKVMNTVGTFTETAIVEPSLTSQKGCIEPFEVQVEVTVNEIDPDKVWLEEVPTYSQPYAGMTLGECCKLTGGLVTKGGKEIPGTWAWKNPSYSIQLNYTSTQYMVFTPDDSTACDPIEAKTSIKATRYAPTGELEIVYLPEASDIELGQPLSASVITGGTAEKNLVPVPGVYTWKDPTIVPPKGSNPQKAIFTPDDSSFGAPIEFDLYVYVYGPEVRTKPVASEIKFGQTLAESKLTGGRVVNGANDIPGTFAWKDSTIIPPAGTSDQTVVFTPTDPEACVPIETTVSVTASAPKITEVPHGTPIEVGHKLSESVLSGGKVMYGGEEIPGTFAWKDPETVMTQSTSSASSTVIFTPTDPNACAPFEGQGYLAVNSFTIVEMPKYDYKYIPGDTYSDYPLTGGVVTKGGEPIMGTWAWLRPNDVIQVGVNETRMTFKPYYWQDGSTKYFDIKVTAEMIPLEITWPTVTGIYTVGKTVGGCAQTSGGEANIPGRFSLDSSEYSEAIPDMPGKPVEVTMTFDPFADAYETQTKTVSVVLEPATPSHYTYVHENSENPDNIDVSCTVYPRENWAKHTGKLYATVDGKRMGEITENGGKVTLTDLTLGVHEFGTEYVAGENDVYKSNKSETKEYMVRRHRQLTVTDFAGTKTTSQIVGFNVTAKAANHENQYYVFDKWEVEGTALPEGTDLSAQELTFKMPDGDVTMTATYKFSLKTFFKIHLEKFLGWFIDVLPQLIAYIKGLFPQK